MGYSPTAARVLIVVLLPHEHPPQGLWHVVTAWPAARQWREAYAAEDLPAKRIEQLRRLAEARSVEPSVLAR